MASMEAKLCFRYCSVNVGTSYKGVKALYETQEELNENSRNWYISISIILTCNTEVRGLVLCLWLSEPYIVL